MKRINVVGTSGVGKSSFSQKLAEKLNYKYIEMDQIFWEPNWTQPSDETFFARMQMALMSENWVLDGNYTRTLQIKWEKVDVVIWLDYSFVRTLSQAILRAIKRSLTKEELWEGTDNRESFSKSFFTKESIIWWMITTHKQNRLKYESYLVNPKFSHIRFVRLRNHAEAKAFLKNL
jgi:adenylate kinase family enzyme